MNSNIILISGKKGSGKSSLADNLEAHFRGKKLMVHRYKFAEPVYDIHNAALPVLKKWGLVPKDCKKARDFLEVIGEEYGRQRIAEDVWAQVLAPVAKKMSQYGIVIIDDMRYPNEFDLFEGAHRIRLAAEEGVRRDRCPEWGNKPEHKSDLALDEYAAQRRFDFVIRTDIMPPLDVFRWALIGMGVRNGNSRNLHRPGSSDLGHAVERAAGQ